VAGQVNRVLILGSNRSVDRESHGIPTAAYGISKTIATRVLESCAPHFLPCIAHEFGN
jgi:hypothetical protein